MRVAVFSVHNFERDYLSGANADRHEIFFIDVRLNEQTARLAAGFDAVSILPLIMQTHPCLKF